MKKLFSLFLLGLTALQAQAQVGISFSWTSNGNPNVTTCAGHTHSCINGYTLTDTTNPSAIIGLGNPLVTDLTYTLTTLPAPGVHTYSLYIDGLDATGNVISSPAVTTQVTVPAPFTLLPPVGFTGKVN